MSLLRRQTTHSIPQAAAGEKTHLGTGRNGEQVLLDESTLLKPQTMVRSPYEAAVKEILLKRGMRAYYEPFILELAPHTKSFNLDFLIDVKLDGRLVMLEPHHGRIEQQKRVMLGEAFGNLFYFVHINWGGTIFLDYNKRMKPKNRVLDYTGMDERWIVPIIGTLKIGTENIPKGYVRAPEGFAYNKKEYRRLKRILNRQIRHLIRRANKPVSDLLRKDEGPA